MTMIERATATAFERTTEATATAAAPADASLATLPKITSDVEVEVNAEFVQSKTDSMTELPPLDLRGLERKQSASTSSSSSSPVDDSDASSDDLDDVDDIRAYADDREAAGEQFLVKPMSSLPVCPFDDLAVEDEKRRRRSVRLMKKDKSHRTHCPDAESLPSPSSQLTPKPRRFTTSRVAPGGDVARPPLSAPTLRRDSMAIRQQYWKQLGLSMSRRDLERNTGKRRERHVGLKVQLNDARAKKDSSKSIFQIIASWYASDEDKEEKEASLAASDTDSATDSSMSPRRKGIRFNEEAELFYIPLHKDYSKRQRDCMWHSRAEFISMVERNLEEVYEEMEREYEEQCHAEMLENEAMAKEEARQRLFEAQMQARAAKAAEVAAAARASPPQQRTASPSPVSSPPMLALCPTQIKVTPRARSPHDLRFKYLKHLGIDK